MSLMPISYLLSGPLEEKILGPIMAKGKVGEHFLGSWLGSGEAGGIRLFFIIIGICWMLLSIILWIKPDIQGLDEEFKEEKKLRSTVVLEK